MIFVKRFHDPLRPLRLRHGRARQNRICSLYASILMRNAACSNSNVIFLHLLFIFSSGKAERPFNQKKKKEKKSHLPPDFVY